ncbi:MAG: hypothetical protein ABW190_06495 [Rhizobacter sp.]
MSHLPVSTFLRNVLLADAVVSGAAALVMLAGGSWLQALLQLPAWVMLGGGATLLAYAVFVGWLSKRRSVPRALVWSLVVINLGWALDCAVLAFGGWWQPSGLGQAFLGVQIAAVLVFAELQFVALRRDRASGVRVHA